MRAFILLCLFACCGVAAEEGLLPLLVKEYDSVYLKNDDNPLVGNIMSTDEDGSIHFQGLGKSGSQLIQADLISRIEPRQSAAEVVVKRGGMQLKNGKSALDTLKFGIEKKAFPETVDLAVAIMQKTPGDIAAGELALKLFRDQNRPELIEPAARGLIAANPAISGFAFEALAQAYIDEKKNAELDDLLKTWLQGNPTSAMANRLMAAQAELAENWAQAQEAYRKCFELHKDLAAGNGYARVCLIRGDYQAASDAALKVIASPGADKAQIDEAHALAGSALLGLGNNKDALTHLLAQSGSTLRPDVATYWSYNLGLAYWKNGDADKARQAWSNLTSPEGELALAIVDHKPFLDEERLTQPQLKQVAQELNACLLLEGQRFQQARAALNPKSNKRHQFLDNVAELLKNAGSEASVRAVAATPGPESLRWQAYGMLLARKFREAEEILKQLPENDGYAAVYRVYAAAGLHDDARAKELFAKVAASDQPPKDYVARLTAEYAIADDEIQIENFDWVDGDELGSGWQVSAPGTNIRVHAADGKLAFDGTQAASDDAVTSAWMMFPSDRLGAVQVNLDIAAIGGAIVGLELLDEERRNGVAYAIDKDNKMTWRMLEKGEWGDWQPLALQIVQSVQPNLRLQYSGGRVYAVSTDDLSKKVALNNKALPMGASLCLGVFGAAEPGVEWKLSADQFRVEQKSNRR